MSLAKQVLNYRRFMIRTLALLIIASSGIIWLHADSPPAQTTSAPPALEFAVQSARLDSNLCIEFHGSNSPAWYYPEMLISNGNWVALTDFQIFSDRSNHVHVMLVEPRETGPRFMLV
jgi:hypothetical protein